MKTRLICLGTIGRVFLLPFKRKRQISQRKEGRSAETNQRCGSKELCSCAKLSRISRG